MSHALIIDDNMVIGHAIQSRLLSLGFDSSDHTCSEERAVRAAEARAPDLVVVGQTIMCGSPVQAARHIGAQFDAPVLLVTSGMCEVRARIPRSENFERTFPLSEIRVAVTLACSRSA